MTVLDSGWKRSWLAVLWEALEDYREEVIPEGVDDNDETWDRLTTAMAWIREEMGLPSEVEDHLNGVD